MSSTLPITDLPEDPPENLDDLNDSDESIPLPVCSLAQPEATAEPGIHDQNRPNDLWLLAALSLSHFFNDFCMGITTPMIPSMERKFGLTLGAVAGIITITNLTSNFTQPVAGLFLGRSKTSLVLLICPFLCGLTFLIGWMDNPWQASLLFLVAGAANGAFHPFSFVLAQTALPRRPALSAAIFLSFGFLGVAMGAMVSGRWMEYQGFSNFHLLYIGVLVTVAALVIHGTGRIKMAPYMALVRPREAPTGTIGRTDGTTTPPFGLIWVASFCMAFEAAVIFMFAPKLFKILFNSEGRGGDACFILGIVGGSCSYLTAYWADRGNPFKVAAIMQAASILPFIGFFYFPSVGAKLAMIALIGATSGSTLPILSSMARHARGFTLGLRTSLVMGGVWGISSILIYFLAQLPDMGYDLQKVMSTVCIAPVAAVPLLVFMAGRYRV